MPSLDGADHPLISVVQEAFNILVQDQSVDIVQVEDEASQDACEVQADDWTLFLEGWPLEESWIAIDDDVSGPEQLRTALEGTLDERAIEAMQSLDAALSGAFVTALTESGDEISIALAAMIHANVEG